MEVSLWLTLAATCVLLLSPHFTLGQDEGLIEITAGNSLVISGKESARIQCLARGGGSEDVNLRWYGPNGQHIGSNFADRVYAVSFARKSLSVIIKSVLEQDSGEYICNGTINGKPKSNKISVHVNMPLEITEDMAPRSQELKENTLGLIKCTAPKEYGIYFTKNGRTITQEHPRYAQVPEGLEISRVNHSLDEGTFVCVVSGSGRIKFINIKVTVLGRPKIITSPSAGEVVEGNDYRFVCRATGRPSPKYHWFKDESNYELGGERFEADKQTGDLIIKQSRKDDEGLYRCEAKNKVGVVNAITRLIVINLQNDNEKNLTSNTSSCEQVLDDLCSPPSYAQSEKRTLDMLQQDVLRLEIKKTETEIEVLKVQKLKFQEEIDLLRLQKEKLRGEPNKP
ncbi:roundabout homolog 2-like [Saccostrea cucullata]|uniref:roundabout homolog 2-like n=1 Tax=Saccostrea cuccullata TaxID=36930 RepID=UPI002ED057BD